MSTISDLSAPDMPPLSPGSSVSTRLQDEYDELLKFAVVVPNYNPDKLPSTLMDARESFLQQTSQNGPFSMSNINREPVSGQEFTTGIRVPDDDELSEATDVTPINGKLSSRCSLPDFGGQSPIPSLQIRISHENTNNSGLRGPPQHHSQIEMGEYERVYTATVDPDVAKIETLMDQWCLDLKRNILAEFSQSKIRIVEQGRQQLVKEQERHASEKMSLLSEMDGLKELLATYEKSIERKDQVISNLTNALQKQKDKNEMTKRFCEWKIRHNDHKREIFCTSLAKQYHERKLSQKVWAGWHSVIESRWKQRIEKACQAKAQEVCLQLTKDYEGRLNQVKSELESSRVEISKLHAERDRYEEMMKKAFMRGVCALNLEAMSIFQNGEEKENRGDNVTNNQVADEFADNMSSSLPNKDYSSGKSLPQEIGQTGPQSTTTQDRIVTSQGSRSSSQSTTVQSKTQQGKGRPASSKVLTTRVTSKVDSGKSKTSLSGTLAPPMSSVVVERHQPVTKQTMGHAIAEKYVRPTSASTSASSTRGDRSAGISHKTIAGQGSLNSKIVKHVE